MAIDSTHSLTMNHYALPCGRLRKCEWLLPIEVSSARLIFGYSYGNTAAVKNLEDDGQKIQANQVFPNFLEVSSSCESDPLSDSVPLSFSTGEGASEESAGFCLRSLPGLDITLLSAEGLGREKASRRREKEIFLKAREKITRKTRMTQPM